MVLTAGRRLGSALHFAMLAALQLVAFLAFIAVALYCLGSLPLWIVNRLVGRPSDAFEAEDRARDQSRKNS